MSDDTLRTSNNRALWLGLAITLGPLAVMPFAARSPAYQEYRQPAPASAQPAAQSGVSGVLDPTKPARTV